MNETPTPQADVVSEETGLVVLCPFCGVKPRVESNCYGHQMGMLIVNAYGKKCDPLAGMCWATTFRCTGKCPADYVQIHDVSLNDSPRTKAEILLEALRRWNRRVQGSGILASQAPSDNA